LLTLPTYYARNNETTATTIYAVVERRAGEAIMDQMWSMIGAMKRFCIVQIVFAQSMHPGLYHIIKKHSFQKKRPHFMAASI